MSELLRKSKITTLRRQSVSIKTKQGTDEITPIPLRSTIMTFNAWGTNLWPDRKNSVTSLIHSTRPDIILLQESTLEILEVISKMLPYHCFVSDFDSNIGWQTESNILWNALIFEDIQHGAEPLNMPDYPNRCLFWVRLRDRSDPTNEIFVATMHLPWPGCRTELKTGINQRVVGARTAIEILNKITKEGESIILGGDMNEDYAPGRILGEQMGFIDVFETLDIVAPPTHPVRPSAPEEENKPSRTLDWIYTNLSGKHRVVSAYVKTLRTGYPPASDHMPVIATIELATATSVLTASQQMQKDEEVEKLRALVNNNEEEMSIA